jgi:hypothetical protein
MKTGSLVARLIGALSVLAILISFYVVIIRPLQLRLGATREEVEGVMPGDDLVSNPTFLATRAITIQGRPEDIWPWIVQMGYDRAGYYGYDLIENIGSKKGIRSEESIVPELQHPKPGDLMPISSVAHLIFGTIEPDRYLIWQSEVIPHDGAFTWALYPIDEGHTRLVSRIRLRYHWTSPALVLDLFTEFADHVAVPKILAGVKDRTEGQVRENLTREIIEIATWTLAFGLLTVGKVSIFRWRRWSHAWCVALGSGFLVFFVLYTRTPTWIDAAFGCAISVVTLLLSRKNSLKSLKVLTGG